MSELLDRETRELRRARRPLGIAGRMAQAFIQSKLTPLLVIASLALGVFATVITPREEEPQIQVPMIDVMVPAPGATPAEVESRVAVPLERLLMDIPGIDYVYTTSSPNFGMAIARFKVGQDPEESLVKLYTKLMAHPDLYPPGYGPAVVKPRGIDDVPIVTITFWGERFTPYQLRRVAAEAALELKKIPGIAEATIIGGVRREIAVRLDDVRLRAHGLSGVEIAMALERANWRLPAGSLVTGNREVLLSAGGFLSSLDEVRNVVVGVSGGRAIRLGDVARVEDGPAEATSHVSFGTGPRAAEEGIRTAATDAPAVTVQFAKKPGSNAVGLAAAIESRLEGLRGTMIPAGMEATITRNYGETAEEKSNELISHVLIATAAVVLLMWFALGRREAVVVAVAVPVTLALTLAMSTVFGYTLNRVTLFALVFAIGILVDDAIVVVENIHRHLRLGWAEPERAAVYATDEVGNPTILATFAVIAALLPLAYVGGLMGPYMRPIPINASSAMFFSLLVAFIVTPWITLRVLGGHVARQAHRAGAGDPAAATKAEQRIERWYAAIMRPLITHRRRGMIALGVVVLMLFASTALLGARAVKVKMLPFDNKSEFQVIIDMPEGTTLETTTAAARAIAAGLRDEPEVTDYQVYAGTAGPINFNGLVRHYFLRQGPNVADIQVNLAGKHHRKAQSHEIAVRVRKKLLPIAERWGANMKVLEVPPGPPVLSTMVAEIYGPDLARQREVAADVKRVFESTPGVVDIDWYVEDAQPRIDFRADAEKAALAGISTEMIARELRIAGAGAEVGVLHTERDRDPVPIVLRTDRGARAGLADAGTLALPGAAGQRVPLSELVTATATTEERSIYHKNLKRVTYVTADVAGEMESPVYGILDMRPKVEALRLPEGYRLEQKFRAQPGDEERYRLKWDGEWQITYEVFRDMGIAFAVVMLLVYGLVVAWFRSFIVPLIIMAPIPLTLIGILPGHWATGMFFTATSMIGFIALSGIIVRNSILLVDFIILELEAGAALEEAVLKAGAVRMRPILLTAAALVVGGLVIVLDPIFQGLAVSLMFGVVVATVLTLVVIPLLYYLHASRGAAAAAPGEKS